MRYLSGHCRTTVSQLGGVLLCSLLLSTGCKSTPTPAPIPQLRPLPAARQQVALTAVRPASANIPDGSEPEILPALADRPIAPEQLPSATAELRMAEVVLTLAEAINWGLRDNPRLRQVAAQSQVAQSNANIAYAPFLPELGTSVRYSGFTQPVLPGGSFVPASISAGVESFMLAEAGVQYTIADFGRRAGRYGQAVHQARSQELSQVRATQTIAFEVVQAYLRLLVAQSILRVRDEALRDANRILADTKARLEGGVVERESVLRSEVELSEAKQHWLRANQEVRNAEATLNVVMGRSPTAPLRVADIAARPPFHASLEECLNLAIAERREIGMAREAVAEARHAVQEARGEQLPKVYVRGTAIQVNSPGSLNGSIEGIGIHVDQPLYAGGRYQNQRRMSEAQVVAALAGLQTVLDNVSLQVTIAFQAIDTDRQRIELAESAVVQARENLRLLIVRYQNGNATPTDIVDAQTALVHSQTSFFTAVYGYLESLARLEYSLGSGQQRLVERLRPPWAGVGTL
jgi:outer membrane protein TolC